MGGRLFGTTGSAALSLALLLTLSPSPAFADEPIEILPTIDGEPVEGGIIELDAERTVSLGVDIQDTRSGFPLGDLHPAFWVRPAVAGRDACSAAVDRYLSLGPNAGIDDDLNGYLFATVNADHSIGVMDPKLNLATSNLLSLTPREGPADAWWLDPARVRLFIASADAGSIERLDLLSGDLEVIVDDLDGAGSIASFAELDRLWIAGETRVDGIALSTGSPVRSTDLPDGTWQIEADQRGLRLLALDHVTGRFLILHPESGAVEREIALGGPRGMFVHDAKADAAYALSEDGASLDRLFLDAHSPTRHPLPIDADRLLLTEGGKWLAGLNTRDGRLVLVDAASLRPVHVLDFDGQPSQMRASEHYLYLLENGTGYASLVHLPSLSSEKSPGVLRIPIGSATADGADEIRGGVPGRAAPSAIAPLVEGGGAVIASASDKTLYLYMETGMQAPANAFKSWTSAPKGVALLDRRPSERRAGRYETAYRPRTAGGFELVVYLPNPSAITCFEIAVSGEGGGGGLAETQRPPKLRWTRPDAPILAGEPVELRFRLEQPASSEGLTDGQAAEVLVMAPGRNWHWRGRASPMDDDQFVLSLVLPEAGSYQLLVRAPGRHLDFTDQQPHSLDVVAAR